MKNIALKEGIQILREHLGGSGAYASLGAQTVAIIDASHQGINSSFLMKKVSVRAFVRGAVVDETYMLGLARGDSTIALIKSALEDVQLDSDRKAQAQRRDVILEVFDGILGSADQDNVIRIDASLGGGKGIPFEKAEGWQWFVYNPDDGALSAGSQVVVLSATIWGIWLE